MAGGKHNYSYFAVLSVFAFVMIFAITCGDESGQDISDRHTMTSQFTMGEGMFLSAFNQDNKFDLTFDGKTVRMNSTGPIDWWWNFELTGIGRANALSHPSPAEIFVTQCTEQGEALNPEGCEPTLDYRRDGVTEWYTNSKKGLVQGFTISLVPAGKGLLTIQGRVDSNLFPHHPDNTDTIFFSTETQDILKYFDLTVFDATGRALDAWVEFTPDQKYQGGQSSIMRILVDDSTAARPLLIQAGATIQAVEQRPTDATGDICTGDPDCNDGEPCTTDTCTGIGAHDETVGSTVNNSSGYNRTRGNYFECTAPATFTGTAMWIALSASTQITAGVWESNTQTGTYTLIDSIQTTLAANGTNWYTISGFTTPLVAGKFYAIGFTWGGASTVGYYWGNVGDQTVSFGTRKGYLQKGYLPATFTAGTQSATIEGAHQRIMTSGGTGTCAYSNNTNSCDDSVYCNGTDTCNSGTCSSHSGNPCTDDGLWCNGSESCNEGTDSCDHSGTPCVDDGTYCNGAETCIEATDTCGHAGDPCTDDGAYCNGTESCNEGTDSCDHSGSPCADDGTYCNGAETCIEATDTCGHAGDPCTDDGAYCNGAESCNEGTDSCDHSGNPCSDDGVYCNGTESCNEGTDSCDHSGSPCADDGTYCNGAETCDEAGDTCGHAGNPCSDDGAYCNGTESCNEGTDSCDHSGTPCADDNLFCNGAETCDETNDTCGHAGNPCPDDGSFCTGVESCDENNDSCQTTGNPCLDDSAFCNGAETCDEASDTCGHSGNPCDDDNLYCNGAESCDESNDTCAHSGDPCDPNTQTCNETTDVCDPITDDDDDDTTNDDDNDQVSDDDDQAPATDDDDDSSGGCCG